VNSIFANFGDGKRWKEAMLEPIAVIIIFGFMAFLLR